MYDKYTIAEAIYTAYCESVGGTAWNGEPLPTWNQFHNDESKERQVYGWLAAAQSAINLLTP